MKANFTKKVLTPIFVCIMCIAVLLTGIYCSIMIADRTPLVNGGNNSNNSDGNDTNSNGSAMADKLPDDHHVQAVDEEVQYETGSVRKGYSNNELTNVFEINTKSDLQAWLLSPENGGRDARLMKDIAFNWSYSSFDTGSSVDNNASGFLVTNSDGSKSRVLLDGGYAGLGHTGDVGGGTAATYKARIAGGRILEGMGKTITYETTIRAVIGKEMGYFAYEIYGTMQNINLKTTAQLINLNASNSVYFYAGFLANQLYSGGIIDNVKVTFGNSMGVDSINAGGWGNTIVGGFVGKSAGTIKNSEVDMGATGKLYSWASRKGSNVSFGHVGGFVGQASADSSMVTKCTLNVRDRTDALGPDPSDGFKKAGGGVYGIQAGGKVDGFIMKNYTIPMASVNIVSRKSELEAVNNSSANVKNVYVQNYNGSSEEISNAQDGAKRYLAYVSTPKDSDVEFNWDKTTLDKEFEQARMLVSFKSKPQNQIFWSLKQMNDGAVEADRTHDLFRYNINANSRVSIPTFSPKIAGAGHQFSMQTGSVGKIKSIFYNDRAIVSNAINYTGKEYAATVEFTDTTGGTVWDNHALSPKSILRYSGKTDLPGIPGVYVPTLRAVQPPTGQDNSFAYFDSTLRRLIWADDDYTRVQATLTINRGVSTFTATNNDLGGNTEYKDDTWTSQAITMTIFITGGSAGTNNSRPDTIKLTTVTKEQQAEKPYDNSIWIEEKDWGKSSVGIYRLSKVHNKVPFRVALFRGAIQLTEITDLGILPKVDEVAPTIRLDARNEDVNSVKYINNWMDRYTVPAKDEKAQDSAEGSQIWINSTFGASSLKVEVRAKRVDAPDFSGWGELNYIPHDGNTHYNNIYAQRLYDLKKTRAENQATYGGEWVVQIRAKSLAMKWAEVHASDNSTKVEGESNEQVLQVKVKVDYSDYTVDENNFARYWNGTGENTADMDVLDASSCAIKTNYAAGRNYFYRNEAMSFTLTAAEAVNNLGYSIVGVNGAGVPSASKKVYTTNFKMSADAAIGATPVIYTFLKKTVYGRITDIPNNTYGDSIPDINDYTELNEVNIDGTMYKFVTTPSLTDSRGSVVNDITSIRIPKGVYTAKISAELASVEHKKLYDAEVSSNTFTILPKNIDLVFVQSTLSCSYRNFNQSWVKVEDFSSQVVVGDTLRVTGIAPETMPPASDVDNGPLLISCNVKLSNDNYVTSNVAQVTLAKFLTDSADTSVYLIESADDFMDIKGGFLTAKFKQTKHIDFGARTIKPLESFGGIYDGNGYSISGYKLIVKPADAEVYQIGLFKSLSGATVKNLTIRDVIVEYTGRATATANVGMLAGSAMSSTIDNIMVQGSITVNGLSSTAAAINVGTIVGLATSTVIKDSMVIANLNVSSSKQDVPNTNANAGGLVGKVGAGGATTISNTKVVAQGMINVTGGAGQFVGMSEGSNVTLTNVKHMKDALTTNGEAMPNVDGSTLVYADIATDSTVYGEITDGQSISRGTTFEGIFKKLIPASMVTNGGISLLKVSNFRELMRLTNVSWANFEITEDIYCFIGYKFDASQRIIGKIVNNGGYKIYSDNGVFDIGSPSI